MCKNTVEKIPVVITYVPDPFKTPKTYHKATVENDGTLKSVPDCYKNKKIYNKAVDSYAHVLEFVHNCYKTQ